MKFYEGFSKEERLQIDSTQSYLIKERFEYIKNWTTALIFKRASGPPLSHFDWVAIFI